METNAAERRSPPPALLEARGLSVTFTQYGRGLRRRALHVLREVDITVEAGEVVAVVGASGSGKSLLAHAILGILPYNARAGGTLLYRGEALTPRRLETLRGREIALIPQGVSSLDPLMRVGGQVRAGARDPGAPARAREALGRYGLGPEVERRYPFELSGGMARRVLMATAGMEAPSLVVADEPTPGLDQEAARRVLEHLRQLAAGGAGVMLITHDLERALPAADRVAVLYAGTTVEQAPAADFADEALLRHPYTRALWRAMPRHGFTPLDGAQPFADERTEGCPFAPRCPQRTAACAAGGLPPARDIRGGRVRCHAQ